MPDSVALARQKLLDGGYTCFVLLGQEEYCSFERGVKPLLSFLQSGTSFLGAVAADKTVGAGAAHLYVLLGVQAVWANVISRSAKDILEQNGIEIFNLSDVSAVTAFPKIKLNDFLNGKI